MDILFTETVCIPTPVPCIAFLILLIGASIYIGWAISGDSEEFPFVMSFFAVMISAAVLVAVSITGGLCEKEYVYVNQADVSVEEILEYKVVADLGDVIKLEKIK